MRLALAAVLVLLVSGLVTEVVARTNAREDLCAGALERRIDKRVDGHLAKLLPRLVTRH